MYSTNATSFSLPHFSHLNSKWRSNSANYKTKTLPASYLVITTLYLASFPPRTFTCKYLLTISFSQLSSLESPFFSSQSWLFELWTHYPRIYREFTKFSNISASPFLPWFDFSALKWGYRRSGLHVWNYASPIVPIKRCQTQSSTVIFIAIPFLVVVQTHLQAMICKHSSHLSYRLHLLHLQGN